MEKSIGGLWIKEGKNGKFFTGNIEINGEKKRITVFKNSYKQDKQPDYRIYESKIQEEKPQEEPIMSDDDLPF